MNFDPDALHKPLSRKKPTTYFVNSMSDLFHEGVPIPWLHQAWNVMRQTPHHTYQILTKRAEIMRLRVRQEIVAAYGVLPNVWLGVSVENQHYAEERIPELVSTQAAIKFLSCEPLLGPLDLSRWLGLERYDIGGPVPVRRPQIDWVIVGGESGPGARPLDEGWIERIVKDCQAAGVPVFVKQMGTTWSKQHGGSYKGGGSDIPARLRITEMPRRQVWTK